GGIGEAGSSTTVVVYVHQARQDRAALGRRGGQFIAETLREVLGRAHPQDPVGVEGQCAIGDLGLGGQDAATQEVDHGFFLSGNRYRGAGFDRLGGSVVRLEQPRVRVVHTAHLVVVEHHAPDAAVGGQH